MLPEDSETVLSTLRTLFAVPPYLSPQFFSSSLSFCFSHDSLLLGALSTPNKGRSIGGG